MDLIEAVVADFFYFLKAVVTDIDVDTVAVAPVFFYFMFFAGGVYDEELVRSGHEVDLGGGGFAFDDDVAGFGGGVVTEFFEGFVDAFVVVVGVVDGGADLGGGWEVG